MTISHTTVKSVVESRASSFLAFSRSHLFRQADFPLSIVTSAETYVKLSIVLPAYNESTKISENVLEVVRTIDDFGYDFEVLIVDDGSRDATSEAALKAKEAEPERVRVIQYDENRGKGSALMCGAQYARGDVIVFLDSDMDIHPSQLPNLLDIMTREGADVVIGSKQHPLSRVSYPRARKVLSKGYFLIVRSLFGLPVRDTQTGLKVFRTHVLSRVGPFVRMKGFAFDLELLCLAHTCGYRLVDAPVVLEFRRGQFGRIRVRDIVEVFSDTLRIFFRLRVLGAMARDFMAIREEHSATERVLRQMTSALRQQMPEIEHADADAGQEVLESAPLVAAAAE
jgi:glycosyltransferase involved in cell wall biosynthesis